MTHLKKRLACFPHLEFDDPKDNKNAITSCVSWFSNWRFSIPTWRISSIIVSTEYFALSENDSIRNFFFLIFVSKSWMSKIKQNFPLFLSFPTFPCIFLWKSEPDLLHQGVYYGLFFNFENYWFRKTENASSAMKIWRTANVKKVFLMTYLDFHSPFYLSLQTCFPFLSFHSETLFLCWKIWLKFFHFCPCSGVVEDHKCRKMPPVLICFGTQSPTSLILPASFFHQDVVP